MVNVKGKERRGENVEFEGVEVGRKDGNVVRRLACD